MSSKNFFPVLLITVSVFFAGCSNDAPASNESQQSSTIANAVDTTIAEAPDAAPKSTTDTTSSNENASSDGPMPKPSLQPGEVPTDTTSKSAPIKPSKNEVRSDARPSDKVVKHNSPFKSTTTAAVKKQNPAGNATGFIGRKNIGFYNEPSTASQKISTLKIYESVIILETKMTDESGKSYDMPQWYKVQLTNKKIGWVVGSSLTLN